MEMKYLINFISIFLRENFETHLNQYTEHEHHKRLAKVEIVRSNLLRFVYIPQWTLVI